MKVRYPNVIRPLHQKIAYIHYEKIGSIKVVQLLNVNDCDEAGLVSFTRSLWSFRAVDPAKDREQMLVRFKMEALMKQANYVVLQEGAGAGGFMATGWAHMGMAYRCGGQPPAVRKPNIEL